MFKKWKKNLNILAILVSLSLLALFSCTADKGLNLPNIILINIDDMGLNDVSFMGSEYYCTPYIDALASQGFLYPRLCRCIKLCPSRASIHSGKWTTRHQIYTVENSDWKASDRKLIPINNTIVLDKKFTTLSQN